MLLPKIKNIPKNTNGQLAIPALAGLLVCYGIRPDICLLLKIRPNSGLILKIRPNACRHSTNRLKPNTQRKTELNWTVQFSSVEFSSVSAQSAVQWTGVDELRRPSQVLDIKNRRRPSTNLRRPSPVVAARRWLLSNDRHCVDWPIHKCVPIVKNLRWPPISSPVQCTTGNWIIIIITVNLYSAFFVKEPQTRSVC